MTAEQANRSLQRLNARAGLYSPEELVEWERQDGDRRYNEVALRGRSPDGAQTTVTGIFVITNTDGTPRCSAERLDVLRRLATQHDLPIVYIPRSANP